MADGWWSIITVVGRFDGLNLMAANGRIEPQIGQLFAVATSRYSGPELLFTGLLIILAHFPNTDVRNWGFYAASRSSDESISLVIGL